MSNYQLGKIYQIVCLTTGQKYIGSTTQKTLAERLAGHKRCFKNWKNGTYHFVTSFTILEHDNFQIELIESVPCNSKDELNAREGHYIRTIDCVNKQIAGRTKKEYYEQNKTETLQQMKEYRKLNKTKISEKQKEWYDTNKTEVKEKSKEWREANKAIKSEKDKAYREANKTKIAEKAKAKYLKKKAELQ